jgi:hypothetical protein
VFYFSETAEREMNRQMMTGASSRSSSITSDSSGSSMGSSSSGSSGGKRGVTSKRKLMLSSNDGTYQTAEDFEGPAEFGPEPPYSNQSDTDLLIAPALGGGGGMSGLPSSDALLQFFGSQLQPVQNSAPAVQSMADRLQEVSTLFNSGLITADEK